jgi:aspartate kinase
MGKSTNTLEDILNKKLNGKNWEAEVKILEKYHLDICVELFPNPSHNIYDTLRSIFKELKKKVELAQGESQFEKSYDSVVSFGEIISSTIISKFISENGTSCHLLDARSVIKTDRTFKEGKVIWNESSVNIKKEIEKISDTVILSQGFISSTIDGSTTTLGREGSDFTAAIFASALEADSVTFWKDVPGIMNADPKLIEDAVLLDHLPYQEAAEMTYYGAKVIHPKTIRPLANNNIPLFVKGFDHPDLPGTSIKEYASWERIPVIIYKEDQCLVSCKFTDFSFVNEESLVKIFDALHELDIKVNMMQNSAISFSVCFDFHPKRTEELINRLSKEFNLHYNSGLTLVTIKNYSEESLNKYRPIENVLLEQQTRANFRAIIKT